MPWMVRYLFHGETYCSTHDKDGKEATCALCSKKQQRTKRHVGIFTVAYTQGLYVFTSAYIIHPTHLIGLTCAGESRSPCHYDVF